VLIAAVTSDGNAACPEKCDHIAQVKRMPQEFVGLDLRTGLLGQNPGTPFFFGFKHPLILWGSIGWGIGLVVHGLNVFAVINFLGPNWGKKQIEKRWGGRSKRSRHPSLPREAGRLCGCAGFPYCRYPVIAGAACGACPLVTVTKF
jgi:hypothetical protein